MKPKPERAQRGGRRRDGRSGKEQAMSRKTQFVLLRPKQVSADEPPEGHRLRRPTEWTYDALEVPPGVSYLRYEGGRPELTADAPATGKAFVVEPLELGHRPVLVVVSPQGDRVRVNGQIAPRVTIVAETDEMQLDGAETVLYATCYRRSTIGPPPAESIGEICPICRTPFVQATTVYVCPGCGQALHLEGPERGAERLECARMTSTCPTCYEPVNVDLSDGYSYVPAELE
jgi:hypothetical protein